MPAEKPLILIITGLPCSGKTPLGMYVAENLRLPFINKDMFKELLFDNLGWSDREWSKKVGEASYRILFSLLESQLAAGQGCVVESNFRANDAQEFQRIFQNYPCQVFQIVCTATPEVLLERFEERIASRHPGHIDHIYRHEFKELVWQAKLTPLDVGGSWVEVDTSWPDLVDVDGLIRLIRETG